MLYTLMPAAGSADKIDLKGNYEEFMSTIAGGDLQAFLKVAAWVGAAILGLAIFKYVWNRRRGGGKGGGGGSAGVLSAAIVGGILVAPNALLPFFLGLIDAVMNAFISIGSTVFG